ncbi:MAG TPA: MFS transporter [Bacteroides sp.]|nr:MFS transporter [Bacteroides sp.]
MKYKINILFVSAITMISAMGGLLFGYDWVVIGGAKHFYEIYFNIMDSPNLQGWATSSALIGCIAGAILAGTLSDKYGRKPPLIFSALLFTISAIGTGMAENFTIFIVFRLVGGIGIGMAALLSPIYIAEISPARFRGLFVSINQLTIVIGILLAQIVNYYIAEIVPEGFTNEQIRNSWNGQMGWRWMFWAETILSISFLFLAFLIPESPRWLVKADKGDKALKVLSKIGGMEFAAKIKGEIQDNLKSETTKINLREFKHPKIKKILMIGVIFAILQQMCGINVIFIYSDEIFTNAGYGVNDMLFNIIMTGSVNLLFTLIALGVIDSWGRRLLMKLGYGVLAFIYIIFGIFYKMGLTGPVMLVCVLLAIGIYALALAPTTWVVLSEIFPNKVRGVAMSIATFALWSSSFLTTYSFPIINKTFKSYGTFWIYAGVCVLGFIFVYKFLPETKGKTLEEIEDAF